MPQSNSKRPILKEVVVSLCLVALGASTTYAWMKPAEVPEVREETVVVPPLSALKVHNDWLRRACSSSKAFASLVAPAEDLETRTVSEFRPSRVVAEPLSDRGILCVVEGELLTQTPTVRSRGEKIRRILLVAVTGESEEISPEFAEQLQLSLAVKAMSSNVGNDGTLVPAPKPLRPF